MKKSRLFVLGAGFSAGAAIPMTNELLKGAIKLMKEEALPIYQRIENSAKICFENDKALDNQELDFYGFVKLSSFLHYIDMRNWGGSERWSAAGDRETLTFKYFIAKYIAQIPLEEIPDVYLEFAKQLDCYDIVMTFNWDCLLEKALDRVGKKYLYNPKERDFCCPKKQKMPLICKMHGSIHWTLPHGSIPDERIYKPMSFEQNFEAETIYYSDTLKNNSQTWKNNDWLLSSNFSNKYRVQPYIILPGIGKTYDVRKLSYYWDRPQAAFFSVKDVYFIGFSASEDDFFVRFMISEALPLGERGDFDRKVIIINPDSEVDQCFGMVPQNQKIFRCKYFDMEDIDFIDNQRSNL